MKRSAISRQLAAFWRRLFPSRDSLHEGESGKFVEAADPVQIDDGVDYSLPLPIPQWVRRMAPPDKLRTLIQEAAGQTFRFQFDTPQRSFGDLPIMPITEDPLREWDWPTRERVLSSCHSVYQRNPIAKAAVDYTISFAIGDGFNLSCKNPDVEKLLNDFIDHPDNAIRQYEKECLRDLQLDGEIMLRVFEEKGMVVAAPLRPWECWWIKTAPGFFRRKVAYHFNFLVQEGDAPTGSQTMMEDVAASEIIHVTINKHGYELRGRPELVAVLPWLRAHKEWLENRARINHWRSAFVWWVYVKTKSASVLSAVIGRWTKPPKPGSVVVSAEGEEVKPLSNDIKAQDAGEDGRQIKMQAITGLRMAEYMLGDGQNANLASAKAQQLPALTKFEDFQQILREQLWYPLFKRVIEAAVEAGQLKEEVEECDAEGDPVKDEKTGATKMIKACKAFDVSYEPVGEDSPVSLAQAYHQVWLDGAISMKSYRARTGFEPDVEAKQIEREQMAARDAMPRAQLPPMPGVKPGQGGVPGVLDRDNADINQANDPEADKEEIDKEETDKAAAAV